MHELYLVGNNQLIRRRCTNLNDGCGHPARIVLRLSTGCHASDGAQVVHLIHRHGDRGRGQAHRNQRVWHHHERQLQTCWIHKQHRYTQSTLMYIASLHPVLSRKGRVKSSAKVYPPLALCKCMVPDKMVIETSFILCVGDMMYCILYAVYLWCKLKSVTTAAL